VRLCYQRAEVLCHSLNRPLVLFYALIGQWRHSFPTDTLAATMQIAQRAYGLAQEQGNPALMVGGYQVLAVTLYFLGDFESSRQYAMRGVQIWRSGNVQPPTEDPYKLAVLCLSYQALSEWHLGEISCQANIVEAISLGKELKDMPALAHVLHIGAILAYYQRNPAEVDHMASDLIELATRHNFAFYLTMGSIYRGWARSASGHIAEGISLIEDGIREHRASGSIISLPFALTRVFAQKALRINRHLKEWGAVGFRSEFMIYKLDWLHGLHASTFDTDPFEPRPDGYSTIFPF
jgi:hypothetical protein